MYFKTVNVRGKHLGSHMNSYVEFIKMCMQYNYFQFNGHYYRQTFGTSMGNALSPFLANIFMADLETRLSKLKIFPKIWTRYVNDIFCVMKKNTIVNRKDTRDNEPTSQYDQMHT
jgi:hypothetical protein